MEWIADQVRNDINEMNEYYVYILASKRNGTLYIGITNDLIRRVHQHRTGEIEGFTEKYKVHYLVWYENSADVVLHWYSHE